MKKILYRYKWFLAILLVLMIVEPALNSVLNFWLQKLFSAATPGTELSVILKLLCGGYLIWMSKRVVLLISSALKNRYVCNIKRDIKKEAFENLYHINTSSISQLGTGGDYISLFTNDVTMLEERYLNQIMSLISSIFSILILGGSFLALNRKLATAMFSFSLITMTVPLICSKALNRQSVAYVEKLGKFTSRLKEYLAAYPTVKNFCVQEAILRKFDLINEEVEDVKFDSDYTLAVANNVAQLLSWFMQLICVGAGLVLVTRGEIVLGTVIAAQSFASDLATPLQNLLSNINSIKSVHAVVERFNVVTGGNHNESMTSEQLSGTPTVSKNDDETDITFSDFSLNIGDHSIVKEFSYHFEPGKKYLLIGRNGCGKSTLFKTLKKWRNILPGHIFIGGRDIAYLSSNEIGRLVSYLNENVTILTGTVRENIELYRNCSSELFEKAISEAQVLLDPERVLNEDGNGMNVSSGEQRRIELARALINPDIRVLILDEVVSTLDIETAYTIEKLALSLDKTVIFVSHNFSGQLMDQYDEILYMEDGCLIDHGSFKELVKRSDAFRNLCQIKFGPLFQQYVSG